MHPHLRGGDPGGRGGVRRRPGDVEAALFAKYAWIGRTIEYHRYQIRDKYGTHPATEDEEDQLAD
ncbi:hypothetical protein ABH917_001448 [Thermobifida halotolerans]